MRDRIPHVFCVSLKKPPAHPETNEVIHNQYFSFSWHLLIAVHMIRVSANGWKERRKCGLLELEIFNEIARDQGQPLSILQDLGLLAPSPILRLTMIFPHDTEKRTRDSDPIQTVFDKL